MSAEGEGGVEAGDVLREEFTGVGEAGGAGGLGRIPVGRDGEVGVVAWVDGEVSCGGVAEAGAVAEEIDVHVRNGGRVWGWVCDID